MPARLSPDEEIKIAIAEALLPDLLKHTGLRLKLFEAVVPQFAGRFPHHKLLSHLLLPDDGKTDAEALEELRNRIAVVSEQPGGDQSSNQDLPSKQQL